MFYIYLSVFLGVVYLTSIFLEELEAAQAKRKGFGYLLLRFAMRCAELFPDGDSPGRYHYSRTSFWRLSRRW